MTTDAWGIENGYVDTTGSWRDTPEHTRRALRVAMGGLADIEDPPPRSRPVWFVRYGTAPSIERPAHLVLEDGTTVAAEHALPPDLPLGYHDLHPSDGGPTTRVIVTPSRCHLPPELRAWGLTVQLYAARSTASWGMGDLGDLRRLGGWLRERGAGFVAVNPLHAPLPAAVPEASPYYPSTRLWRSPLYLQIEEVPGWDAGDERLAAAAVAGRALNAERLIDRTRVWHHKQQALELLWSQFNGDPDFDRFLAEHGAALVRYGAFCTLVEQYGTPWPQWPGTHRRPDHPGVDRFAAEHRDRVRFHCWLQWLVERQLASAGATVGIVTDLAVGFDPVGFDAWLFQDVVAGHVRIGAPPDDFNRAGQDWGLPPFIPWKVRASGYAPLVDTMRAVLRHAAGTRIDHVMGLFRLYWIPPGTGPEDGGYVRFPGTELLDVVALESVRAGALVIGEDLGTVETGTRELLQERGALSYQLVWFEDEPPEQFPVQALAAVSTHDLPTIAGLWSGADERSRTSIGLTPDQEGERLLRRRIGAVAGLDDTASAADVARAVYERLARSPSMLVSATLDDIIEVEERPNHPGTLGEWPNWKLALPAPLESIEADSRVLAVTDALDEGRRCPAPAD